jgi:hypothetical protein
VESTAFDSGLSGTVVQPPTIIANAAIKHIVPSFVFIHRSFKDYPKTE